jgi:hypothetical protein
LSSISPLHSATFSTFKGISFHLPSFTRSEVCQLPNPLFSIAILFAFVKSP